MQKRPAPKQSKSSKTIFSVPELHAEVEKSHNGYRYIIPLKKSATQEYTKQTVLDALAATADYIEKNINQDAKKAYIDLYDQEILHNFNQFMRAHELEKIHSLYRNCCTFNLDETNAQRQPHISEFRKKFTLHACLSAALLSENLQTRTGITQTEYCEHRLGQDSLLSLRRLHIQCMEELLISLVGLCIGHAQQANDILPLNLAHSVFPESLSDEAAAELQVILSDVTHQPCDRNPEALSLAFITLAYSASLKRKLKMFFEPVADIISCLTYQYAKLYEYSVSQKRESPPYLSAAFKFHAFTAKFQEHNPVLSSRKKVVETLLSTETLTPDTADSHSITVLCEILDKLRIIPTLASLYTHALTALYSTSIDDVRFDYIVEHTTAPSLEELLIIAAIIPSFYSARQQESGRDPYSPNIITPRDSFRHALINLEIKNFSPETDNVGQFIMAWLAEQNEKLKDISVRKTLSVRALSVSEYFSETAAEEQTPVLQHYCAAQVALLGILFGLIELHAFLELDGKAITEYKRYHLWYKTKIVTALHTQYVHATGLTWHAYFMEEASRSTMTTPFTDGQVHALTQFCTAQIAYLTEIHVRNFFDTDNFSFTTHISNRRLCDRLLTETRLLLGVLMLLGDTEKATQLIQLYSIIPDTTLSRKHKKELLCYLDGQIIPKLTTQTEKNKALEILSTLSEKDKKEYDYPSFYKKLSDTLLYLRSAFPTTKLCSATAVPEQALLAAFEDVSPCFHVDGAPEKAIHEIAKILDKLSKTFNDPKFGRVEAHFTNRVDTLLENPTRLIKSSIYSSPMKTSRHTYTQFKKSIHAIHHAENATSPEPSIEFSQHKANAGLKEFKKVFDRNKAVVKDNFKRSCKLVQHQLALPEAIESPLDQLYLNLSALSIFLGTIKTLVDTAISDLNQKTLTEGHPDETIRTVKDSCLAAFNNTYTTDMRMGLSGLLSDIRMRLYPITTPIIEDADLSSFGLPKSLLKKIKNFSQAFPFKLSECEDYIKWFNDHLASHLENDALKVKIQARVLELNKAKSSGDAVAKTLTPEQPANKPDQKASDSNSRDKSSDAIATGKALALPASIDELTKVEAIAASTEPLTVKEAGLESNDLDTTGEDWKTVSKNKPKPPAPIKCERAHKKEKPSSKSANSCRLTDQKQPSGLPVTQPAAKPECSVVQATNQMPAKPVIFSSSGQKPTSAVQTAVAKQGVASDESSKEKATLSSTNLQNPSLEENKDTPGEHIAPDKPSLPSPVPVTPTDTNSSKEPQPMEQQPKLANTTSSAQSGNQPQTGAWQKPKRRYQPQHMPVMTTIIHHHYPPAPGFQPHGYGPNGAMHGVAYVPMFATYLPDGTVLGQTPGGTVAPVGYIKPYP
ncbi:MAG: hypothetical protein V4490_02490 [Pseudomonadota bacterium]